MIQRGKKAFSSTVVTNCYSKRYKTA